jgi:formylglycine-generating enzyme required for sulfatase activity
MKQDLRALPRGFKISDYLIDGVLGQGGFGITYLAVDTMLDRRVAIKEYYPREFAVRDGERTILPAGSVEDRETFEWGRARFLEEARILARFEHPNIIAVKRFFEANGTAYLVMDYCDGESLDEIVKRDGPLDPERLNALLLPLLDGLEQVHATNFLHRDIKPANVYIRSDGSPVLLDFGAARQEVVGLSRSVTTLATPGYAAFEQYSTKGKQGPWTDIYGMAATLYRAVTGEKPQDSPDRMLDDTLQPASELAGGRFSASLLSAIDKGMAVRPVDRPQSVKEWRALFGTYNAGAASARSRKPPPLVEAEAPEESPSDSYDLPLSEPSVKQVPEDGRGRNFGPILAGMLGGTFLVLFLAVLLLSKPTTESASQPIATETPVPVSVTPAPAPLSTPQFDETRSCDRCPVMVHVPAGTFFMGSDPSESGHKQNEGPKHQVAIGDVWISKYKITFNDWEACVRDNGCVHHPSDEGWGRGMHPLINVSWFDAQAYIDWLSQKTQQKYRLLTEAEWEYAARGGTTEPYGFADGNLEDYAWFASNSGGHTTAVGNKRPNSFGLYDMIGNTSEWTLDCWNDNYAEASTSGDASMTGNCGSRVIRGGSWSVSATELRVVARDSAPVGIRLSVIGFRIARSE